MAAIFTKDALRASVEAASGGKVTVLYDDSGYPSYMYVIPKFNVEDIDTALGSGVHPAFIVGGTTKSEIFIGQYLATILDSRAQSIPGQDPSASIDFDGAKLACTTKGPGWHMMTNWEWAAVVLWAIKNGFQPRGNTNYGRAHDATYETAVRGDGGDPGVTSGTARTNTGSGPASWRHDNTFAGIADLVGNIWEWVDGFKINTGEIFMPNDNNYSLAEASWPSQSVFLQVESGAITIGSVVDATPASGGYNANWKNINIEANLAVSNILKQSLVSPKDGDAGTGTLVSSFSTAKGAMWANSSGESLPLRGAHWSHGSAAGLVALNLDIARSTVSAYLGFRPAFIG